MASRFWVGGTDNWDASTTTHWSATTGGAGGTSVPSLADAVIFDINSGTAATVTVTAAANALSISINKSDLTLATGAYAITIAGTGTVWAMIAGSFAASTSTILISDTTPATKTFAGGGKTYSNLTIADPDGKVTALTITGANTFNTLTVPPGTSLTLPA